MFDLDNNPDLFQKLHWQSDWNSDDLGYDGDFVIGLYSYQGMYMYINMDNYEILEAWFENEED